jgi:putative tricarboxylic transport membrane protein
VADFSERCGGRAGALSIVLVAALMLTVGACTGGGGGGGDSEDYPSGRVEIMAPADPGGGWDQTARTMQQALTEGGVTEENVEVYNVPGGSGTVGLSQFISDEAGDPNQLMVMGLVMVGGIHANDSPVDLSETTPIASLLTEWEAIVVPADSEFENLDQLVEAFEADPGSISWGGGSAGGTDHILVGQIAQEVDVDPEQINYVAHAGGGELMGALLSGGVSTGVTGLNEIIAQVESGELRLLAISSEERLDGIDAPTIKETGLDIVTPNWRGLVAPPEISDDEQQAIIDAISEMRETDQWQQALEENNWTDFWRTGEEFGEYLEEENRKTEEIINELGISS